MCITHECLLIVKVNTQLDSRVQFDKFVQIEMLIARFCSLRCKVQVPL